mgnify:CR=1 FL=1
MEGKHTKRLLYHNSRIIIRVINDCGIDKVSIGIWYLSTNSHFHTMFLDVIEETLYTIVLHFVLNRSEEDAIFETFAYFEGLGVCYHSVPKGGVDR